nr:MAG TPA: hypothetical protein [Caudoviricetes sp.]
MTAVYTGGSRIQSPMKTVYTNIESTAKIHPVLLFPLLN